MITSVAASALLQLAAITVPQLKPLFKVGSDDFTWQWLLIGVLALTPVSVVEITKLVRARTISNIKTTTA